MPLKEKTLADSIKELQQPLKNVAQVGKTDVTGFTQAATTAAKQLDNYQQRLENSGVEDTASDTRNWFEKITNLPENQFAVLDALELLGRPQQALFGALDAAIEGRDPGAEALKGITGEERYSGGELLRGIFAGSREAGDWNKDWTHWAGTVLDMVADPADLFLIPLTGGLSAVGSAAIEATKYADDAAKGLAAGSKLAKAFVKYGDDVVKYSSKLTEASPYALRDTVKALSDSKLFNQLPDALKTSLKLFSKEFDSVAKTTGTIPANLVAKFDLASKSLSDDLAKALDDAASYGRQAAQAKAARSYAEMLNSPAGKIGAFIDYYAIKEHRTSLTSLFFKIPSAGLKTTFSVGDSVITNVLKNMDESNMIRLGRTAREAGENIEEALGKYVSLKDTYLKSKQSVKKALTKSGTAIEAMLRKGSLTEEVLKEQATIAKAKVDDAFEKFIKDNALTEAQSNKLKMDLYNLLDLGETPFERGSTWKELLEDMRAMSTAQGAPTTYLKYSDELYQTLERLTAGSMDIQLGDLIKVINSSYDKSKLIVFNYDLLKDPTKWGRLVNMVGDNADEVFMIPALLDDLTVASIKNLMQDGKLVDLAKGIKTIIDDYRTVFSNLTGISEKKLLQWSKENDWRITHILSPELAAQLSKKTQNKLEYVFGGASKVIKDRKYNMSALETNYLVRSAFANFAQSFPERAARMTNDQIAMINKFANTDMFIYDVKNAFNFMADKQLMSIYRSKVVSEIAVKALTGDLPDAGGVLLRKMEPGENVPKGMQLLSSYQKAQLTAKIKKINQIENLQSMDDLIKVLADKNVLIDKKLYGMINRIENKSAKGILELYDKFNIFYKSMKTLNPSFNIVNVVGNAFNMWVSGMSARNVFKYWGIAGTLLDNKSGMKIAIEKAAEVGAENLSTVAELGKYSEKEIYEIAMLFFEEGILDRNGILKGSTLNQAYISVLRDLVDGSESAKNYGVSLKALDREADDVIGNDAYNVANADANARAVKQAKVESYENSKNYLKEVNPVMTTKEYNAAERASKVLDHLRTKMKGYPEVSYTAGIAEEYASVDPALLSKLSSAKNSQEVLSILNSNEYADKLSGELKDLVVNAKKLSQAQVDYADNTFKYTVNGRNVKNMPDAMEALMTDPKYRMGYEYGGKKYETFEELRKALQGQNIEGKDIGRFADIISNNIKSVIYDEKTKLEVGKRFTQLYKDVPVQKLDMFKMMLSKNLPEVKIVPMSDYVDKVNEFTRIAKSTMWDDAEEFATKNMPEFFKVNVLPSAPSKASLAQKAEVIRTKAIITEQLMEVAKIQFKGGELGIRNAFTIVQKAPRQGSKREISDAIAKNLGFTRDLAGTDTVKIGDKTYSQYASTLEANKIISKHNPMPLDSQTEAQRIATTVFTGKDVVGKTPAQVLNAERTDFINMFSEVIKNGGGTYNPTTLKAIDYKKVGGYQTSIRTLIETGSNASSLDSLGKSLDELQSMDIKELKDYLKKFFTQNENQAVYEEFLGWFKKAKVNIQSPDEYIGAWIDNGALYVDNSIAIDNLYTARIVGDTLGEKAITKNDTIDFINLKASGEPSDSIYTATEINEVLASNAQKKLANKIQDPELAEETAKKAKIKFDGLSEKVKEGILSNDPEKMLDAVSEITGKTRKAIDSLVRANMWMNAVVDQHSRMALYLFAKDNPSYLKQLGVETPMEAVKMVLFDPYDVTYFEKDVMKRLIPFYTFTKKNIVFQASNIARHSKKYNQVYKLMRGGWSNVDQDLDTIPEYQYNQGYVPIPTVGEDGKYTYIKANIPFYDFVEFMNNPLNKVVASTTPLVRASFELATNKSVYTGQPIADYSNDPGKLYSWTNEQQIGVPKLVEYGLGQIGLDSPMRFIESIAESGYGLGKAAITGELPTASDALFAVGDLFNIAKEGNVISNRQSAVYEDLDRMKTLLNRAKDYGVDIKTLAESENQNKVLEDLKQRLSSFKK